jgi:hypothetical protein
MARRRGKQALLACSENYANDVLPTYKLGDGVHDIFTENELEFHYQTIRTLITEAKTNKFARYNSLNGSDEGLFVCC